MSAIRLHKLKIMGLVLMLLAALPMLGQAENSTRDALVEIQHRLLQVPLLRASFVQEKHVAGFIHPLVSQGDFTLVRDKGIIWQVNKPFPSEMVLTRNRVMSRRNDGSMYVEADGREQPGVRAVNTMMVALMAGDMDVVSKHFHVEAKVLPHDKWELVLTPRSTMLAKAIVSVKLGGDRYVQDVAIEEANHDRSEITFSGFSEIPALSDAEDKLFE